MGTLRMRRELTVFLAGLLLMAFMGCGGSKDADEVYLTCEVPEDCDVPDGADAACIDKSGEGFCTWECQSDEDCVEASDTDFDFVCASFESELTLYCFPACDSEAEDAEACPPSMSCRSTGGGSNNRKVCFPDA